MKTANATKMGAIFSLLCPRKEKDFTEINKQQEEKPKIKITDYEIENQTGITKTYLKDTIPDKMPLSLYKLEKSEIKCISEVSQVTIEECTDCFFYIQECIASVYMRDCKNCIIVGKTGQLRIKNSIMCKIYVSVNGPVIESSHDIEFFTEKEQFYVYDFTPQSVCNYKVSIFTGVSPQGLEVEQQQ